MKMRIVIPLLILLLLTPLYGVSCEGESRNATETLPSERPQIDTTPPAEVGQVLDIRVEPASGASLTRGILLDHATVQVGSLNEQAFVPQTEEHYYVGDCCLLVLGDMINDTDEDLYVDLWAEGFDTRERQVAWSVSSGTIIGHVQYYIPHQSSESFEIPLNWAEDVQLIKIIAHSYDRMIPSPPESTSNSSN